MKVQGWHIGLLAAGLVTSCAALLGKRNASSPVDRIKPSHAAHVAAKVDCGLCHEGIYEAKTLDARHLPKEKICLDCHADEKQAGKCGFCHTEPLKPATYLPRERTVRMSHEKHIPMVKEDCARCHTRLPEFADATRPVPAMATCLGCHEHKQEYAQLRCTPCHVDLSRYPLEPMSMLRHEGNYVRAHGAPALSSAAACAQCHEQTFCADCHAKTVARPIEVKYPERVESGFIHRGDYLSRHSIEAQADPALCSRCHGGSFCQSCHTAQSLTSSAQNPRDPHPIGWSIPGSASFHGPAARRDISSCASCHDQGPRSNCVGCHRVGGIGGNPHPAGWTSQHPHSEIQGNGMCMTCHL